MKIFELSFVEKVRKLLCNFSIRFSLDTKPFPFQLAALYMSLSELNIRNLRRKIIEVLFVFEEIQYAVN
jgi:hypothetical protein